jgi:hypothetical protein
LYLQLSLPSACALAEDVQNEGSAVCNGNLRSNTTAAAGTQLHQHKLASFHCTCSLQSRNAAMTGAWTTIQYRLPPML